MSARTVPGGGRGMRYLCKGEDRGAAHPGPAVSRLVRRGEGHRGRCVAEAVVGGEVWPGPQKARAASTARFQRA